MRYAPASNLLIIDESDNESDSWYKESVRVNCVDGSEDSSEGAESPSQRSIRILKNIGGTNKKINRRDFVAVSPRGDLNGRRRNSIVCSKESSRQLEPWEPKESQLLRIQS